MPLAESEDVKKSPYGSAMACPFILNELHQPKSPAVEIFTASSPRVSSRACGATHRLPLRGNPYRQSLRGLRRDPGWESSGVDSARRAAYNGTHGFSSKGARGNGVWLTIGEPLDRVRME